MQRLSTGSIESQSSEDSQGSRRNKSFLDNIITPEYRQLQRQMAAKRPPMVRLDPRLRVNTKNHDVPTLHFGLAFTRAEIVEFADRHDLLGFDVEGRCDPDDEARRFANATLAAQEYLKVHYRIKVFIEKPLLPEYGYMFALYSNYSRRKLALIRPAEKKILNIIREELGLGDQRAHWYWDAKYGPRHRSGIRDFDL